MCFNDTNFETNGELKFFNSIKNNMKTIFDVGCRSDSLFLQFPNEVHYFDPEFAFLSELQKLPTINSKSFYNNFGLSDKNEKIDYYPKYQSFVDRVNVDGTDVNNKKILELRTAYSYIEDNKIEHIDFLKIDTEGYELKVIKGFGDKIDNVDIIQFEYGGTWKDINIKLLDMVEYLKPHGFINFYYLSNNGLYKIIDYTDHYQYCNIICMNENPI